MDRKQKKGSGREEEVVEIALAAAGAALILSIIKHHLPCMLWRLVAPSPLPFLLLHVVIASIAFCSAYVPTIPCNGDGGVVEKRSRQCCRVRKRRTEFGRCRGDDAASRRKVEEEKLVADEELNAKAEAFIKAFRRQLVVDAVASGDSLSR